MTTRFDSPIRLLTALTLVLGAVLMTFTMPKPAEASHANSSTNLPRTAGYQQWYAYANKGERIMAKVTWSRDALSAQVPTKAAQTVTLEGPGYAERTCTIPKGATTGQACFGTEFVAPESGVYILRSRTPNGTIRGTSGAAAFFSWQYRISTADGVEIPGRVWSPQLYRTAQTNPASQDRKTFSLWFLSADGWLYRTTYRNFNGIYANILATSQGIARTGGAQAGLPLYKSLNISTVEAGAYETLEAPTNLSYKVFYERPADDLPESAPNASGVVIPITKHTSPQMPTLSNLDCQARPVGTPGVDCTYEASAHRALTYFEVDTNGDGDYSDLTDRRATMQAGSGSQTVSWDGKDSAGQYVAPGSTVNFRVRTDRAAEIHFTQTDVEYRSGISVRLDNPPNANMTEEDRSRIFWDDSLLSTNGRQTPPAVTSPTTGRSSNVAGIHPLPSTTDSNGWGNNRIIDDWAYMDVDVSDTTTLALPEIPEPSLTKAVSIVGSSETTATRGQTLRYVLTLTNPVDGVRMDDAMIRDDLSDVLDDATFVDDSIVSTYSDSEDAALAVRSGNSLAWTGPLDPGQSITVVFDVITNDEATGDDVARNVAIGCEDGAVDCDPEDVPEDCAVGDLLCGETTTPIIGQPDVEVTKTSDIERSRAGGVVTYRVTARNTGDAAYDTSNPLRVTDDLSKFTDDAVYNGDAEADRPGTVGVSSNFLTWVGELEPGDAVTIEYTATIKSDEDRGDSVLDNVVIAHGTDDPVDLPTRLTSCSAVEASDDTVACAETSDPLPLRTLDIEKSSEVVSEADPAGAGARIDYTVTMTNTGGDAYTVDDPATLRDDLTGVLDDADLDEDSVMVTTTGPVGTVQIDEPIITWNGPLGSGESVTLTYSVTAHDPLDGDDDADNVAFALRGEDSVPAEGATSCEGAGVPCAATSDPLADSPKPATTPEEEEPKDGILPRAGGTGMWTLLGGIGALMSGALLVGIRRRSLEG